MKRSKILYLALVGMVAMGFSSLAWSRADGALTWRGGYDYPYKALFPWTDSKVIAYYWIGDRSGLGDTTKWSWNWDTPYRDLTTSCAVDAGCTVNFQIDKTTSITLMKGLEVATPLGADVSASLSAALQVTRTRSESYTHGATVVVPDGYTLYAGVIRLSRKVVKGPVEGLWERDDSTNCVPYWSGKVQYSCRFKWNKSKAAGTWGGYMHLKHRTFLCTMKGTLGNGPRTGDAIPSQCSPPGIPPGWAGSSS